MNVAPIAASAESSPSPSLCVIVCCYTLARWDSLIAGTEEVRRQLLPGDRLVIVVDHADDLRDRLAEHFGAAKTVAVLAAEGAPGLSQARNTGLAAAHEDVVVFLDDDAVPEPAALAAVRTALADPTVIAIGGAVTADWAAGAAPEWFPDEFGWVVGCDYRGLPPDGAAIRNPIGAAMAVRREPLEAVGGFSSRLGRRGNFPAGCEETLMGIALRRDFPGESIRRDTAFRVRHTVSVDRGTPRYFTRRCYQEGRSKALLAGLASTGEALSSERAYTTRVLPSAVLAYRRRPARALAVVVGFVCTAAGFVAGTLGERLRRDA